MKNKFHEESKKQFFWVKKSGWHRKVVIFPWPWIISYVSGIVAKGIHANGIWERMRQSLFLIRTIVLLLTSPIGLFQSTGNPLFSLVMYKAAMVLKACGGNQHVLGEITHMVLDHHICSWASQSLVPQK